MGDPWLDSLRLARAAGQLNWRRYFALEEAHALALAEVAARRSGQAVATLMRISRALVRASAMTGVPLVTLAGLVDHETGAKWYNEPDGSVVGYIQQTVRYAHEHWPYELPDDTDARRRIMLADIEAQALTAARHLVKLYQRGNALRAREGERTYREHARAHADLFRAKGGQVDDYPNTPVRWTKNPYLAMYNRGTSGGAWPLWTAPNRPDGSNYQLGVERRARMFAGELDGVRAAASDMSGADVAPTNRMWAWR